MSTRQTIVHSDASILHMDFENVTDQSVKEFDYFMLGMSDNVPVSADFNRVKKIANLVKYFNTTIDQETVV